jgi:hypothetical protein
MGGGGKLRVSRRVNLAPREALNAHSLEIADAH